MSKYNVAGCVLSCAIRSNISLCFSPQFLSYVHKPASIHVLTKVTVGLIVAGIRGLKAIIWVYN